jgi:hypothetical protein
MMRKRKKRKIFLFASLGRLGMISLALLLGCPDETERGVGHIEGVVKEDMQTPEDKSDDQPLEKASVKVFAPNTKEPLLGSSLTDKEGKYRVSDISVGEYDVVIIGPGGRYQPFYHKSIEVKKNQTTYLTATLKLTELR